jgi:3-carboxy-cis,cis-muconate cycloisomerase
MSEDLFAELSSTSEMRTAVSGRAWLQALLDAESALAAACAAAGLIPTVAADAIRVAGRADDFDLEAIATEAVAGGNPVIPVVSHLRARLEGVAADTVHFGATSQDILDTAMVLVVGRAVPLLDRDLARAATASAELADAHRGTLMAARTLLQQALPTTFGLKAARWLDALVDARHGLNHVRRHRLAAQLGGAAGTLASFGDRGVDVASAYARELGLAEPSLPWHTARGRIAELAGAVAVVVGTCDKIALDIGLLAQTEVGEVSERSAAGRGGSSTLPHKQNPVGVASVRAARRRALGPVGVLVSALDHEHERALGAWQAEWDSITQLLMAAASATSGVADILTGLDVHPERMQANLDRTGGLVSAEAVVGGLAPHVGRRRGRDLVEGAAREAIDRGTPLRDELLKLPAVARALDAASIDRLLDPANYLGANDALINRALARFRTEFMEEEDGDEPG